MKILAAIGLGLVAIVLIVLSVFEVLGSAQQVIAPDNHDREAIEARHGKDTPEARAALRKRFGPGDHWRDAMTGVGGIVSLVLLYWLWFG